ncbi:hypothetical protein DBR22_10205 [Arthrobacter sp. HMWF013]|nr:hypothetical protein DBR22_10205 [Arthrobacter sp. HMWF013]
MLAGASVIWSLSIDEQFYIVFALIWLLAVKSRHWRPIVTGLAALGVLWSIASQVLLAADPSNADRIYYGSDTRLVESSSET